MQRRSAIKLLFGGTILGGGAAYSFAYEPGALVREEVSLSFPTLPADWDGLRIAFLSDLHVGPYTRPGFIEQAVEMALAAMPDLALLGGDFVHRGARFFVPCAKALAGYKAPLGTFAVTGNHDHWDGVDACMDAFRKTQVQFLRNSAVHLHRTPNGTPLVLAGVDDLMARKADPARALGTIPDKAFVILLSHNPDLAEHLDPALPTNLILSGHTHGGQVRLPFIGAPVVPSRYGQKYAAGLARKGPIRVYTTRGIGTITPPVRINCPPEVTILTLHRG